MSDTEDYPMTINIRGWLTKYSNGENDDLLGIKLLGIKLDQSVTCLAELVADKLGEGWHLVSVSWITGNREITEKNFERAIIQTVYGDGQFRYGMAFSETTGYLWTNEDLRVCGHDIIEILKGSIGKFLYLRIVVHEPAEEIVVQ